MIKWYHFFFIKLCGMCNKFLICRIFYNYRIVLIKMFTSPNLIISTTLLRLYHRSWVRSFVSQYCHLSQYHHICFNNPTFMWYMKRKASAYILMNFWKRSSLKCLKDSRSFVSQYCHHFTFYVMHLWMPIYQ